MATLIFTLGVVLGILAIAAQDLKAKKNLR